MPVILAVALADQFPGTQTFDECGAIMVRLGDGRDALAESRLRPLTLRQFAEIRQQRNGIIIGRYVNFTVTIIMSSILVMLIMKMMYAIILETSTRSHTWSDLMTRLRD